MINTYVPYLNKKDKSYLLKSLSSNFISTAGPNVKKFEEEFCSKYNFRYSVPLNSGTSALHLALLASGVKKEHLVLVPSYTFAATVNAINYCGAEPFFTDIDQNFIINIDQIEDEIKKKQLIKKKKTLIDKKTKKKIHAIIVVQSFGSKIDLNKFNKFAKKYSLKIIFDSAACHNPDIMGFKKETSQIFCFSFNGNKTLSTGAGGIAATNSKKLADKLSLYSTVGKKGGNYDYELIGYNYKMTNVQASLGLSQLKKIREIHDKKRKIFDLYSKLLKKNNKLNFFYNNKILNWVFFIILKNSKDFLELKKQMNFYNIQLDYFWKPLHLQKPYKNYRKFNLSNSKIMWKKVCVLPSHPSINKQNQSKICKIINKVLN